MIITLLTLLGLSGMQPLITVQAQNAPMRFNIWHIATTGSDVTGDGSENNPFATIQHGIDIASDSDTVLVHPGTYMENINFNGKNITVTSLFHPTGNEAYISQTVIDGNRDGRVVTFENGEDSTAILGGFTITNGYVQGSEHGGGIICLSSSPSLTNLRIIGNEAGGEGGGIYLAWSSSNLRNLTLMNNVANGGGGIRWSGGSPNIENVIASGNSAHIAGGGMQFWQADAELKNVLLIDNFAGSKGGGMHLDNSNPNLMNVTIADNSTSGCGGGLNVSFASHPHLTNSIVWHNSPEQICYDLDWAGMDVTIEYSDVKASEIITNNKGSVYWGVGNIDTDPLFVGSGDYHLSSNSPCIGAGTPDNAPNTDIEGNPRPNPAGSNPDMGAYENPLGMNLIAPMLAVIPPAATFVDDLVYIPVRLNNVHSTHDLRGVQFSLKVTDTQVLSPATSVSPILGDLFPGSSMTSIIPTGEGWGFLLTDLVSTPAVSGTGVVVTLPFVARNEGCTTLFFADHQLSNGSAQLIPHSTNGAYLCVIGREAMCRETSILIGAIAGTSLTPRLC
ncbi:MAG: DUF1565 domain-containing protein [Anaerolineae bacterium]|nr:DUF1565 domain-containing protein [Anaerolineae bacterium]